MPPEGSHTKNTGLWMLPEDETAFDDLIRQRIPLPDSAWRCSQPGPLGLHPVHLHPTLHDAMQCGSLQAFIHLPFGAPPPETVQLAAGVPIPTGPPRRATVQYLRVHRQHDELGPHLEAGRLAVRWYKNEVGIDIHELLTEHTRAIWRALTQSTVPAHIADQNGRKLTGYRIGRAARAYVSEHGTRLSRRGPQRFHLL